MQEFTQIFLGQSTTAVHDMEVGDAMPIKQQVNTVKHECIHKEVEYMLQNGLIKLSQGQWSSPCILVPKPDGSFHFCTDFWKVNAVAEPDCHPLSNSDDYIDQLGHAQFVSKFDLLKSYWQVPLSEQTKEVLAFVMPDGLYQYRVMPFGMRNGSATFQYMINRVISKLDGYTAYIDKVTIYSHSWEQHVDQLCHLFSQFRVAN